MADMTREEAKSRLRHIAEDMFAVDDVKAIHTLIEYVESYENADLIERREIWNGLEEVAGCNGCKPHGDCEECEGGEYIDRVAYLPKFNPERK